MQHQEINQGRPFKNKTLLPTGNAAMREVKEKLYGYGLYKNEVEPILSTTD